MILPVCCVSNKIQLNITSVNLAQAERHALRQDLARARTQLLEAQASSCSAEAAANISQEEKAAMAQALSAAR